MPIVPRITLNCRSLLGCCTRQDLSAALFRNFTLEQKKKSYGPASHPLWNHLFVRREPEQLGFVFRPKQLSHHQSRHRPFAGSSTQVEEGFRFFLYQSDLLFSSLPPGRLTGLAGEARRVDREAPDLPDDGESPTDARNSPGTRWLCRFWLRAGRNLIRGIVETPAEATVHRWKMASR